MRRHVFWVRRVMCSAVAAAAVVMGVAGYGTASASTAPGPLSGLSADQIASQAIANLKTARTVRIAGDVSDSGETYDLNLGLVRNVGCAGAMTQVGTGSFKLVAIGNRVWIKPDRQFWEKAAGANAAAALKVLSGKYLSVSATSQFGSLRALCSPSELAGSFGSNPTGLVKGQTITISGQPALQIKDTGDSASIYVSETAKPELLRLAAGSSGTLDFSSYNGPVTLTAPPAAETVNGAKYGF
jgi:hypothetical protein